MTKKSARDKTQRAAAAALKTADIVATAKAHNAHHSLLPLSNSEVFSRILELTAYADCSASVDTASGVTTTFPEYGSLATLARVCSTFYTLTKPLLWEKQRSIQPLLSQMEGWNWKSNSQAVSRLLSLCGSHILTFSRLRTKSRKLISLNLSRG